MIEMLSTRLAVAVGGLVLALTAGTGIASAGPDLGPMVNTTCSYPQVKAALNAQDSTAAALFTASGGDGQLSTFLAGSTEQRQQWAQAMANEPANQPYLPLIERVFATCNNF